MSLDNKAVIVTGAAMGIGRYIALGAAARGANVAVADIDGDSLKSVETELQAHGHNVLAIKTDVRVEQDVKTLIDEVAKSFGSIDYLVNNAAIVPHFQWGGPRWPKARDMDFSFWSNVIATNLHGTWLCSKYAIPYMEARRSGHIVNVFGGGRAVPPGSMAYGLSKEAGVVLTRYLAEEEREFNICVMSLAPGFTIATERAPEEARSRMPGPESAGERFFLAIDAGMELSGHLIDEKDGDLVVIR